MHLGAITRVKYNRSMASLKGRLGWVLIGSWIALVLGTVFATRSGLEPQDCCFPDGIVVAFTTFVIAVFTSPVALVGVYLINRDIGRDRVPNAAVLTVVGGLVGLPALAVIAVVVL